MVTAAPCIRCHLRRHARLCCLAIPRCQLSSTLSASILLLCSTHTLALRSSPSIVGLHIPWSPLVLQLVEAVANEHLLLSFSTVPTSNPVPLRHPTSSRYQPLPASADHTLPILHPLTNSRPLLTLLRLFLLCYPFVRHVLSTFKKRAPRALKEIVKFAKEKMGTTDVRVDVLLNKYVWSQGVRNVPYRVRVRLHRKRNEDEEAKEKLYTHVTHVNVPTFKGLQTQKVEEEA